MDKILTYLLIFVVCIAFIWFHILILKVAIMLWPVWVILIIIGLIASFISEK